MPERFAVLPCNGLDKAVGPLARETALIVVEDCEGSLICPVLYQNTPARYDKPLAELPLVVIDGCGTRCASKLAATHGLRVARKLTVAEALREAGIAPGQSLRPGPEMLEVCRRLAEQLLAAGAVAAEPTPPVADFAGPVEYATVRHDKFLFRVPVGSGYYFNENDCWARVAGNRARVGISDFQQQQLGDITFCDPARVNAMVDQFGEVGTVESVKAVSEIISPFSGRVAAVNEQVAEAPETINEDPYEAGWVVELELADLAAEKDLLLDGQGYLEVVKRKAAEYRP